MNSLQDKQTFNSPISLLTDLVLGVHREETEADIAAKNLLDELLDELGASVRYRVETVEYESPEYPLPFLRFSRSSAYGLEKIREVAEMERRLR